MQWYILLVIYNFNLKDKVYFIALFEVLVIVSRGTLIIFTFVLVFEGGTLHV